MAASPTSVAAMSEMEPPSSPGIRDGKSFVSHVGSDDEDVGNTTVEPREKPARGKAKVPGKDNNQHQIGKIRHLKKEDGEPLWRSDIQYDFLKAIFDNEQAVFTNSYDPSLPKQNFADLYIDTMARSSKTSKVLRDKLLSERDAAKGMAMVCLLVNVGRMNTTLNFFPEMRAQLRTYHAIPSLQAQQDAHAYKQLQDAPRLKSILKGGAEDRTEPNTLMGIKTGPVPRTNPVNLIFVMCHGAGKIAELHFPLDQEFHDLIMKTEFSSASRARAFLWLIWLYLESDFTEEGCDENPFSPGVDYGLGVANQGVPRLVTMTREEEATENVDTEAEIQFGREKQQTRAKILEMDQVYLNERDTKRKSRASYAEDGPAVLPRIRPSKHDSDMDSMRSTPPPRALGKGRGGRKMMHLMSEADSSPARGEGNRKPRPPTAHQMAVERNRLERVEHILDRGLRKQYHKVRKVRRQDGAIFRAYKRLRAQVDPFADSDGEDASAKATDEKPSTLFRRTKNPLGLTRLPTEADDYGEELSAYAAAIRRSSRRLIRWKGKHTGVVAPIKKKKVKVDAPATAEAEAEGDDDGDDLAMDDLDGDQTILAEDELDQTAMMADDEDRDDDDDDGDLDRTELMVDSDGE